ncbi:MAG: hypothetical protein F4Y84_18470 [Caldilineaceae bacterium SB0665_bin_25]|nr:hypothetical protein [Caldilineaceae bacterium SB0665_bin_25]
MNVEIRDREALSSLTILSVRAYLNSRGWVAEGKWGNRATIYSTESEGRRWEYLCPLRDTIADYAESMAEAVEILATVEGRSQLEVFQDLAGTGADVIHLRSANGLSKEALSLRQNAEMFTDAYDMLASAARAAEKPKAAFRGAISRDVAGYLDEVQPLPGFHEGYILTLHSPVPAGFGRQRDFGDEFTAPFPRRATSQLARALSRTTKALDQVVAEGSLDSFEKGVEDGVSANLCDSVAALANSGRGISIGLFWAGVRPSNLPDSQFQFSEHSADILTEAAKFLRRCGPSPDERIMAQVVQLEREPHEFDGRAVILALRDEGRPIRLQVEFEQPVYNLVIQAFEKRSFISLDGDIFPIGNRYELRSPRNLSLIAEGVA